MSALASVGALELQEGQSITIHYKGLDGRIKAIHEITMDAEQVVVLIQAGGFGVSVARWTEEEQEKL